jgi:AmmeMemoRadiSam system protein B
MLETGISIKGRGRSPIVSGHFYPDTRLTVERQIRSFGLQSGIGGNAQAIIAPHGVWDVSGTLAAAAFSGTAGRKRLPNHTTGVSSVVIMASLHDSAGSGLFLSDSNFFTTPLGNLLVDLRLCAELASCCTLFEVNDIPHLQEHSIEVLLPFVKYCFPGAAIIPILLGGSRPAMISGLSRALRIVFEPIRESTLFVIPSSLSKNRDEAASLAQAESCVRFLENGNIPGFISGAADGSLSMCGGAALAALFESGLLEDTPGRLVGGPPVTTIGEEGKIVCYGGLTFG